jgi:hypothetical protein
MAMCEQTFPTWGKHMARKCNNSLYSYSTISRDWESLP